MKIKTKKKLVEFKNPEDLTKKLYEEAKGTLSVVHEAVIKNDINFLRLYEGREINLTDINGLTPLHYAAKLNQVQIAQILWEKGANLDQKDKYGLSPANYSGAHQNFMTFFIDKSADILKTDENSKSLLESIVEHQNAYMVGYIMEVFERIDIKDQKGLSLADYAYDHYYLQVMEGNDDFFRVLSKYSGRINELNPKTGRALIHDAVSSKKYETKLRIILEEGANTNLADNKNRTSLHYAVGNGFKITTQLLLDNQADVNLADNEGRTPIYYAVLFDFQEITQIFLDKGAKINLVDKEGRTPLHYAVGNNSRTIIQLLLHHQADINLADKEGRTPLHWAILLDFQEITKIFLDKKVNINLPDNKGRAALHYAVEKDFVEAVKALLRLGADVNMAANDQMTGLHYAVYNGSTEILKTLIEKGANKNISTTMNKLTPLHLGVELGNKGYVDVLLKSGGINLNALDARGNNALKTANIKGLKNISSIILQEFKKTYESQKRKKNTEATLQTADSANYIMPYNAKRPRNKQQKS